MVYFYPLMSRDEFSDVYFLERVLVLTPEQAGPPFTTKCKFAYEPQTQTINFTLTFHQLCSRHPQLTPILQNVQIFYVDERNRTKHFLGEFPLDDARFLFDDWTTTSIVISYRKHEPPPNTAAAQSKSGIKKSRERTIKEVRAQIQRWRQVAKENYGNGAKGMSLLQAAREIGVSKKSLDDYLRYLRMAQRLNFDFETFQCEKMGFLRAFVKSKLRQPMEQTKLLHEIDSYWDSNYVSLGYD